MKPPTSNDLNRIDSELRYAGDPKKIISAISEIEAHIDRLDIPAEYKKYIEFGRAVNETSHSVFRPALLRKLPMLCDQN